jgi:hypothetical protein
MDHVDPRGVSPVYYADPVFRKAFFAMKPPGSQRGPRQKGSGWRKAVWYVGFKRFSGQAAEGEG